MREEFDKEVDRLLENGVIRPSKSPYSSPSLLVKKKDGSYRLAIDFRALNAITVFDAEPIGNIEEDFHLLFGSVYFSEIDLCQAYYQIPMAKESSKYTAFPSYKGLMEFSRMPFGLVCACASYVRLMRMVLGGMMGVTFYFDYNRT